MSAAFESFKMIGHNHFVLHLGGRRHFLDAEQAMAMLAAVSAVIASSVVAANQVAESTRSWLQESKADQPTETDHEE